MLPESFHREIERGYVVMQAGTETGVRNEWVQCTLAEVCKEINYGLTASATEDDTGTRFLRITDIVSGQPDWGIVPFVSVDEDTTAKYRLFDGDIVIARTGASTGKSAYIKNPPHAVFASYVVRLQAKPEFAPRFIAYYLKSDQFWQFIRGVLGDKSAQPNASASTMTAAPFRAPKNIAEQRAIAHILGTLDDKIELNRRMNQTLEEMARAIFHDWFVDFGPVRARLEGREPYLPPELWDLFPDRLVDSELGEIPEGWEVKALGEVVNHLRDSQTPTKLPSTMFSHFSIPAYDHGQVPKKELGEYIKSSKSTVQAGVVLLSKLNPEIERVWLVDLEAEENAICSTEFLVLQPRPPFERSFVYCLVRSPIFRSQIQSIVTGTSKSHQRAQANSILTLPTIVPSNPVIQAFNLQTGTALARGLTYRREAMSLAAQRDALLPRLVSGEVRVAVPAT